MSINGICKFCGVDYEPAKLVDGYYQIGNAGNLLWFAQQVNNKKVNINARSVPKCQHPNTMHKKYC